MELGVTLEDMQIYGKTKKLKKIKVLMYIVRETIEENQTN